MANFTTESIVRDKFQLTDATLVPSSLVTASIGDGHTVLLRFLDPVFDTGSPDAALILGETLLSGAALLRSLAANEAFVQKRLTVGRQRVEAGSRFDSLRATAETAEREGWEILEPFLLKRSSRVIVETTKTTEVLGDS